MKKLLKLLMILSSLTSFLSAATSCIGTTANCSYNVTATELANKIQGIGITISNPVITHGNGKQVGIFSNGINGANLELDEGIILTGMNVQESFTTNSTWNTSIQESGTYNDPDLTAIDSGAIYNPVIFEFDVTLDENTRLLLIDYQFASEEYNEYVGSQFNDTFGFFVSGGDLNQTYNIARVVDNQTYVTINNINNYAPVTVNNVNNGSVGAYDDATPQILTNSAYFIDNDGNNNGGTSPVLVEYDGLTHTLHATLDNLTPGETYHFKMALADTSDALWDTGVFINKINGLREPSLCYDYSYKQNGIYLTAGFDPVMGPYISADNVTPNDPIQVAMYFKNTQQSEITTSNIKVNVLDINTSQAIYAPQSVYVTDPGSLYETHIDDSTLSVSNSYIQNIPVSSFGAFEYFYTYFSLNPLSSSLNLPIKARIDYDITIPLSLTQSITIPRSSLIDSDIPMCGGGNSAFTPVYGRFNVIENGLYTNDTDYYYNLNTQITGRTGNLSVAAVDANSTDLHDLIPVTTVVGIDILDLNAFHDTAATCSESANSISDRVWVVFDNSSTTPLNTGDVQFNAQAAENAALRIAFFDDGNGSILQLEKVTKNGEVRWNVLNFPDAVKKGDCLADIAQGNDTIAQWCSNAGTNFNSAMTKPELDICMKCVYGYNTNLVCARDNFAIRPEAFLIHIDDQNQTTNPGIRLTNNLSGVTSPLLTTLNLASGYNYTLDINATNHLNNNASAGYNVFLSTTNGTKATYVWSPPAAKDVSGCNDTNEHNITIKMANGESYDTDGSIYQVGNYLLHLEDTSWTSVDSIPPAHHSSAHFASGPDCVLNSNYAASTSQFDNLNGCNISSVHTNPDNNIVYKDISIAFHPYQFDITNTVTVGDSNKTTAEQPFIYMANIDSNPTISVHLNSIIQAHGADGAAALSNYVTQCYSEDTAFKISKSSTSSPLLQLRYNLNDLNATDIKVYDQNGTIAPGNMNKNISVVLPSTYWTKTLNGSLKLRTNINFDRNVSRAINPENINYTRLDINDSAHKFTADLDSNNFADGNRTVNKLVHHYYGKTIAPKVTVLCNGTPCTTGNDASNVHKTQALVYFSIYCNPRDPGIVCSPGNTVNNNLPLGSIQTNDIRWWTNPYHDRNIVSGLNTPGVDGIVGTISEVNYNNVAETARTLINNFTYETKLQYNGNNGLPYDAVMQMQSSPWLIYNETNAGATTNQFTVEFMGNSDWSGKYEEDSTTDTKIAPSTDRRIMW
ncbi:choice-of-anchor L domain-containing protein [Sulfurimonas sp. C5]|uniref:choice-of-anchor L domain-containing protein n=1 Tax=Sulfurimonas sp. C5 TaxID=3036947 RepID=UPI002458BAC8|nr:choice-of-anchor L domain-containing protein [Sulfurimonas sp. C5]MDH4944564.1 choice-of-anchor L domain-containing protein [Sulfurimonas sp. C5]